MSNATIWDEAAADDTPGSLWRNCGSRSCHIHFSCKRWSRQPRPNAQVDTCERVAQVMIPHHDRMAAGHLTATAAQVVRRLHRYVGSQDSYVMGQLAGIMLKRCHGDWEAAAFTDASRGHVSVYRLEGA